jgi:hypothetical protein
MPSAHSDCLDSAAALRGVGGSSLANSSRTEGGSHAALPVPARFERHLMAAATPTDHPPEVHSKASAHHFDLPWLRIWCGTSPVVPSYRVL